LFTLQKIPPQNFANFSEPFQRWASASSSRITGLLQLVHCIFSVADLMFFSKEICGSNISLFEVTNSLLYFTLADFFTVRKSSKWI